MQVSFYSQVENSLYRFSVIVARYKNKWIFCKQKSKNTWEFPGGTREKGESILDCAKRELQEECGAINFAIREICTYCVIGKTTKNPEGKECYGMLYYADVESLDEHLDSEIEKIKLVDAQEEPWTYPQIQPLLFERVKLHLFIDLFYTTLSFDAKKFIDEKAFFSLFIEKATLIDEEKQSTQTPQEYFHNFKETVHAYPSLFTKGFSEKQICMNISQKNRNYLIQSIYEKKYQREEKDCIERGINNILVQPWKDTYKIRSISYQDGVQ